MTLYLIEECPHDLKFKNSDSIIALTPKACYDLDNLGIEYSIADEYYTETDLLKNNFFKSQLEWFNDFDRFLQDNIPELKKFNLKMGTLFYLRIKSMIDSLIIKCHILNNVVDKVNPNNIIFFTHPFNELSLNCKLIDESQQSFYSYIIPILCKEKNICLDIFYTDKKNIKDTYKTVKQRLAKYKFIRNAHFFLKHGKESFPCKKGYLNILLLSDSYNGIEIAKTGLKKGHNIYSIFNDQIIKYYPFGFKKYSDIKIEKRTWNISSLENDNLIDWINEKCQLNVSNIVLPRLQYFISEICPMIFGYFKFFTEFYKKEKINFVIATNKGQPIYEGSLAASNYSNDTESVCILHGDEIFDCNIRILDELYMFDIHISSNIEKKEYLENQCNDNKIPIRCFCSIHRMLPIKKIYYQRKLQNKTGLNKKQQIIYLPTMFLMDRRRIGVNYPDVWYYKVQKSLIEYFAIKKEYDFIWKGIPISDGNYNPIPDFIRDNQFDNIKIATEPFHKYLILADRVICDFGSTGFYESVTAGISTMSLYHSKMHNPRKSAIKYFGNLLQPYSNISEAIEKIDEFLNSDPDLYKKTIDTEDKSVIEILEEFNHEIST